MGVETWQEQSSYTPEKEEHKREEVKVTTYNMFIPRILNYQWMEAILKEQNKKYKDDPKAIRQ